MEILFEDKNIMICYKPSGVLSQADNSASPDLLSLLEEENPPIKKENMSLIHRLDRGVSGLMLVSKNKKSAGAVQAAFSDKDDCIKEYFAVIKGLPDKEGDLIDLLYHDSRLNKTFVVDRMRARVKEARLSYKLMASVSDEERGGEATTGAEATDGNKATNGAESAKAAEATNGACLSLVRIRLYTGRTHQIRAQFSSRRMPILGDGKYGGADNRMKNHAIGLASCAISLTLPYGKRERIDVKRIPDTEVFPWNLFPCDAYNFD